MEIVFIIQECYTIHLTISDIPPLSYNPHSLPHATCDVLLSIHGTLKDLDPKDLPI